MCSNCGCGIPEDKHGDEHNITWSELESAAEANDQSIDETITHMKEMAEAKSGS